MKGGYLMPSHMPKCRITVLKRTINEDLVKVYFERPEDHPGPCEYLTEGQEFIVDQVWSQPQGLCAWAWADLRKDILMVLGNGKLPGMKDSGVAISGCSDWFRPVIFKVEKIE
jgi:uncharacterized repeat protein (TIGR04076 family)